MAAPEIDAVLARLVAQFGSPYDFLRELAQNSMDAGSDRLEVTLERHATDDRNAVFELIVLDTGSGMDETIIDGSFTRLFSSTKADDRTMAGGFGVGFVSVFAFAPDVVIVQTGRAGEAWELVFYPDRTYDKARIDSLFEGTTITLLKRAPLAEYEATSEAIRDSLWRWCRFCPIEVTFEDFGGPDGPELIQDSPTTSGAVSTLSVEGTDESIRVAFAIPPRAVLLRRGLILEESMPARAFPGLPAQSSEHLQLWVDSAELRTTIARDGAVQDDGRDGVAKRVHAAVGQLRLAVLAELEALADGEDRWTTRDAGRYSALHAHLALERPALGPEWLRRPILRAHDHDREAIGGRRAWSVHDLVTRLRGRPVLWAEPDDADASFAAAHAVGLPVLAVADPVDIEWLGALVSRYELECRRATRSLAFRGGALEHDAARPLEASLAEALALGGTVTICTALDEDTDEPPLVGEPLGQVDGRAVVLLGDGGVGADVTALCLDRRHLLVQAALRVHARAPVLVAGALASVVVAHRGEPPSPETLRERLEQLQQAHDEARGPR